MKILLSLFTVLILLGACITKRKKAAEADVKYTCPMHPQVLKDNPGKCPICHMDLIPAQTANTDSTAMETMPMDSVKMDGDSTMKEDKMTLPSEIELSDQQIRLANIQADTIGNTALGNSVVLTGTIAFNEKNTQTVSARVKGRIERLYYKNVGDYIPEGAKIYELYSEELNSAKQEYVLLLKKRSTVGNSVINYHQLLEAAKHKLILWGMTEAQIAVLGAGSNQSLVTTFYSPASGYINQLNTAESAYVTEGQSIIRLANTSTVWVETQAYTSQLSRINRNANVTVHIPQLGNKRVNGKIEFASPEINQQTRINLLRVSIPNPGNELKPGMPAYIYVHNPAQSHVLALPADAVMRTTHMAYVWIKSGKNTFKMRTVITGAESGNQIEIVRGLKPEDAVVTSGAYLLNSEYLLRNGSSSMNGMKMQE